MCVCVSVCVSGCVGVSMDVYGYLTNYNLLYLSCVYMYTVGHHGSQC